jgi:two-component system, LytTR family, response regulator
MSERVILLVDDEALARRGLKLRLQQLQALGENGLAGAQFFEAANADAALAIMTSQTVDVLFLDIQMPGISGLQMLQAMPEAARPVSIFVTAHDQHALPAFAVQAADYLLKPIDSISVRRAWRRAMLLLGTPQHGSTTTVTALTLKDGDQLHRIAMDQLVWIAAAGDYVVAHTTKDRIVGRQSIQAIAAEFSPTHLVRIHRSTLVNKRFVQRLRPHDNGEYFVDLHDGTALKLSRSFREQVEMLLR